MCTHTHIHIHTHAHTHTHTRTHIHTHTHTHTYTHTQFTHMHAQIHMDMQQYLLTIAFFNFLTSSSDCLYCSNSNWTASATAGNGLYQEITSHHTPAILTIAITAILDFYLCIYQSFLHQNPNLRN